MFSSAPGGHLYPEWMGNEGESVSEVLRIRGYTKKRIKGYGYSIFSISISITTGDW